MPESKQYQPGALELWLGREHERSYGIRQEGWVLSEDSGTATPVTLRQPHKDKASDSIYIFANGWTGDLNSMRTPAIEAVNAGHNALTFAYSNTGTSAALQGNAEELVDVMRSLPKNWEQNVMGLSMGGRVAIMAMNQRQAPKQNSATLVASAGFLSRDPSMRETVQHLYAEGSELVTHAIKNPRAAAMIGFAATMNIVRRPQAIRAEIIELMHGSVHTDVLALKSKRNPPEIHFAFGDSDRLIPPEHQEEGIVGMPFDSVWKYQGGHTELVFNPAIARYLLGLEVSEPASEKLALAA